MEYFHKSSVTNHIFQTINIRWNSTFLILERINKVSEFVKTTVGVSNNSVPSLTVEEWSTISDLCLILKPFYQITEELSS